MMHLTYQKDMICYGTHCETKGNIVMYVWLLMAVALFMIPILLLAL